MKTTPSVKTMGFIGLPALLLMLMGLAFCWASPMNGHLHGSGGHWFFWRMISWNAIGISLGAIAWKVGWKRWLKATPILLIGWVALFVYVATLPNDGGRFGWVGVGSIRFNVWELLPVVVALWAARISEKLHCRSIWAGLLVMVVVCCGIGLEIAKHPARLRTALVSPTQQMMAADARLPAMTFLQNQCVGAVKESKWFGRSEINTRYIPEGTASSMPAVAAALFGRWYLVLLCCALGCWGAGFSYVWKKRRDEPARSYVMVLGVLIILPSVMNLLATIGLAPKFDCSIPFASFGGSLAAATWIGLSIVYAQDGEGDEMTRMSCGEVVLYVTQIVVFALVLICGMRYVDGRADLKYMGDNKYEKKILRIKDIVDEKSACNGSVGEIGK